MNDSLQDIDQLTLDINYTSSLNCPIWTPEDKKLIDQVEYWVGGIFVCCLSIPGMLMNFIAILALITKSSNHTTFNSLLISLFALEGTVAVHEVGWLRTKVLQS